MTVPVIAVDGHDGAGKTTLVQRLADDIRAVAFRPFAGDPGRALMRAADDDNVDRVIEVGHSAITAAVEQAGTGPIVLDRAWMTVATLIPWRAFEDAWGSRVPTVLCWADLPTTLERLATRAEPPERSEWHRAYLARYLEIAERTDTPVVRTDGGRTVEACAAELHSIVAAFDSVKG